MESSYTFAIKKFKAHVFKNNAVSFRIYLIKKIKKKKKKCFDNFTLILVNTKIFVKTNNKGME